MPDGTSVQVQLLGGEGYDWPTEVVQIEQRYSDAPPARLRVLTADAFAAAKLGAWIDRGAPRDLYDLWAMSQRNLIGGSALQVFISHGPFGQPPPAWVFERSLDEGEWMSGLVHQTRLHVSAHVKGHAAGVSTDFERENGLPEDDLDLWMQFVCDERRDPVRLVADAPRNGREGRCYVDTE